MGVFKLLDHRLDLKALHLLNAYHFNPFASVDRVPLSMAKQAYERFMRLQASFMPILYDIEDEQIPIGHHKSIKIRISLSSLFYSCIYRWSIYVKRTPSYRD